MPRTIGTQDYKIKPNPDFVDENGAIDWKKVRGEYLRWYYQSGRRLTQTEATKFFGISYNNFNNRLINNEWHEKAEALGWDIKLTSPKMTDEEWEGYWQFNEDFDKLPSVVHLKSFRKHNVIGRTKNQNNTLKTQTKNTEKPLIQTDSSTAQDYTIEDDGLQFGEELADTLDQPMVPPEQQPQLPALDIGGNYKSLAYWQDKLNRPWAKAVIQILKNIEKGLGVQAACEAVGITPIQLDHVERVVPTVRTAIRKTVRQYEMDKLKKIEAHTEKRWDAAAWLLEKNPELGERYKAKPKSDGIQINITVDRASPSDIKVSEDIIDAEYTDLNGG